MMCAADEVIVVADSTKFGRQSLAHLCRLEDVQHLVVDHEISVDWQQKIAAVGAHLHIVATKDNG